MTGVQFALDNCEQAEVTLVSSTPPMAHDFDSDPCWIVPLCLDDFHDASLQDKRQAIGTARQPGTINHQVYHQLQEALKEDQIVLKIGRAVGIEEGNLLLSNGEALAFDQLFLATGFEKSRPGGRLVKSLIEEADLPTAPCGYPLLDRNLSWAPGLYVMGGLAELVLGPVARNITGARSGAELILEDAVVLDLHSFQALCASAN